MRKVTLLALLALLCVVVVSEAEAPYKSLSVTATSQVYTFPTVQSSVMICNQGANEVYFRLFYEMDTPAAATTANIFLPAGTAAVPVCISYDKSKTAPFNFQFMSIVCDTAETATVSVYME